MAMTYDPFFIFALPRSRTAWLANFLTYDGSYCFHEALMYCRRVDDLRNMFYAVHRRAVGNSDCANALLFNQIVSVFPNAKLIVIERPLDECIESAKAANIAGYDSPVMHMTHEMLQEIKRKHKCLVVDYHRLDKSACEAIWQYINPRVQFDGERWEMLNDLEVSIFPDRLIQKSIENVESAKELFSEVTLWHGQ